MLHMCTIEICFIYVPWNYTPWSHKVSQGGGGASFEDILAQGTQLNRIQLGIGIYSVSWGVDIVGIRNRREAFAMGVHRRLGEASSVRSFGDDVAKKIMEYM